MCVRVLDCEYVLRHEKQQYRTKQIWRWKDDTDDIVTCLMGLEHELTVATQWRIVCAHTMNKQHR